MSFDWTQAKKEAEELDDAELVSRATYSANAFVVLWREACARSSGSDFRMNVSILQDRIGIIVEGYRVAPL